MMENKTIFLPSMIKKQEVNTMEVDPQIALGILEAACSQEPVEGLTHTFYKYPARFSPQFARQVIESFTDIGDVVFDPFMGGGTTLVEASALGRIAIGSDINSLAVYISKVKTYLLSQVDMEIIQDWLLNISYGLSLRNRIEYDQEWEQLGYYRNIECKKTWRIKKIIALSLKQAQNLPLPHQRDFANCAILKTAQWALDCRDEVPSVKEFRRCLINNLSQMLEGAYEYMKKINHFSQNDYPTKKAICLHRSVIGIEAEEEMQLNTPKLILTSPPYPGVHILYHRWQVIGRKETPAPYWIANCLDGHGESYYTMGNRKNKNLDNYYNQLFAAFSSINMISNPDTIVVQMLAFPEPETQLPRYLSVMQECGFEEIKLSNIEDQRIWRSVPNRKWYAQYRSIESSNEVVLFHRRAVR